MIYTKVKEQRDNLPIRVYVECSCNLWPLQTKRQHGLIYRNAYRNNRQRVKTLEIIVILIVDCEIGGSPLALSTSQV